jgi:hypothetical protein
MNTNAEQPWITPTVVSPSPDCSGVGPNTALVSVGRVVGKNDTSTIAKPATSVNTFSSDRSNALYAIRKTPVAASVQGVVGSHGV